MLLCITTPQLQPQQPKCEVLKYKIIFSISLKFNSLGYKIVLKQF